MTIIRFRFFPVLDGWFPFHLPVEQPGRRQVGEFEVEMDIPQWLGDWSQRTGEIKGLYFRGFTFGEVNQTLNQVLMYMGTEIGMGLRVIDEAWPVLAVQRTFHPLLCGVNPPFLEVFYPL